jgi:hypothetical protein
MCGWDMGRIFGMIFSDGRCCCCCCASCLSWMDDLVLLFVFHNNNGDDDDDDDDGTDMDAIATVVVVAAGSGIRSEGMFLVIFVIIRRFLDTLDTSLETLRFVPLDFLIKVWNGLSIIEFGVSVPKISTPFAG